MRVRRLGEQSIEADVSLLRVLLGRAGLAQPGGWLNFVCYQYLGWPITVNGNIFSASISRDLILREWVQAVYISTTNNASNYWTISANGYGMSGISSFNTIGYSPGVWYSKELRDLDISIPVSAIYILISAAKTGSPGSLALQGPAMWVT